MASQSPPLDCAATSITAMTVDALASLITIAMERERSLERETQTQAEWKTEQLRTAVLDALLTNTKRLSLRYVQPLADSSKSAI